MKYIAAQIRSDIKREGLGVAARAIIIIRLLCKYATMCMIVLISMRPIYTGYSLYRTINSIFYLVNSVPAY